MRKHIYILKDALTVKKRKWSTKYSHWSFNLEKPHKYIAYPNFASLNTEETFDLILL